MVLETARLNIKPGKSKLFETTFKKATSLIEATPGFQKIELRPCIEHEDVYMLLVWWDDLDSHEINFRQSDRYEEWKKQLHGFYDPFPNVEHYDRSVL